MPDPASDITIDPSGTGDIDLSNQSGSDDGDENNGGGDND